MTNTTRRAILAGVTAAGAMTGAAAGAAIASAVTAAAAPDPIFDLIERHRAAYRAWYAVMEVDIHLEDGDPRYPAVEAEYHRTWEVSEVLACEIFATPPTTLQGLVALLEYTGSAIESGKMGFPELVELDSGKAVRWAEAMLLQVRDALIAMEARA